MQGKVGDKLTCIEGFVHRITSDVAFLNKQVYTIMILNYPSADGERTTVVKGIYFVMSDGRTTTRSMTITNDELSNFETKIQRVKRIAKQLCK